MSDKKLKLKTPIRNVALNLTGEVNSATKAEEICVTLSRYKGYFSDQLVFTWNEVTNCYLRVESGICALWVGRTKFDVRMEDAELIASTFGIRLDKKDGGQSA